MQTIPTYRTIQVRQDDISNGKPTDCRKCAVALALQREAFDLIPTDCYFEVTDTELYVKRSGEVETYFLWEELSPDYKTIDEEVSHFDYCGKDPDVQYPCQPFQFRLDMTTFLHVLSQPAPESDVHDLIDTIRAKLLDRFHASTSAWTKY